MFVYFTQKIIEVFSFDLSEMRKTFRQKRALRKMDKKVIATGTWAIW